MSKKLFFTLFIIFPLFLLSQQKKGFVEISGKVKFEKKGLSGATIKVYDGGSLYTTKTTDNIGRFKLSLPLNKEFILESSKKNFVTKKITFDSHVPETDFPWTYNFTVELFEMVPGLDISALSQPVAKVKYFKEYDDFDYDMGYFNQMKSKVDKIMSQMKVLKKQAYQNTVAQADKLFREKKYEEAIELYEKAIDYDPLSYYPDDQIQKCEKFLAEGNKVERTYDRYITEADSYFSSKNYQSALNNYKKASALKPNEQYPKQKISEINKLIAQQKKQEQEQQKNQDYQAAITSADSYLGKKQYGTAKTFYKKAIDIKPTETYPKQKISEIDKILANQAAAAESEKKYQAAIKKADGLLASKKYNEAKSSYQTASTIKPSESYPKQKISEIDKILANQAAAAEKDKKYQDAISKADKLFATKQYDDSKLAFQIASGIKPDELYPKEKIAEIDKLLSKLANQKTKEDNYKKLISEADVLYNNRNFPLAKTKYQAASDVMPDKQYPKDRIAEIDKYLTDLAKQNAAAKAKEQLYKSTITKADNYYQGKDYNNALTQYKKASEIKPNEQYPKGQISKIKKYLSQLAQNQNNANNNSGLSKEEEEANKKLNAVNFKDKEATKKYLSELAKKYPEGKTVENYTFKNKTVNRIIVKHGDVADDYREVKHSWGGVYYFKNGQNISKTIFYQETKE